MMSFHAINTWQSLLITSGSMPMMYGHGDSIILRVIIVIISIIIIILITSGSCIPMMYGHGDSRRYEKMRTDEEMRS